MCYSNCPYEQYGGDSWGDCEKPSMQGTERAHCYDPSEEDEDINQAP
jgi:hypothetical protein